MDREKQFCVYMMSNGKHGTIYTGVTSNMIKRGYEHRTHATAGFTDKYNLDKLVYYELHGNAETAIRREKRLKLWLRDWKIALIEQHNPEWQDLYPSLLGGVGDPSVKPKDDVFYV